MTRAKPPCGSRVSVDLRAVITGRIIDVRGTRAVVKNKKTPAVMTTIKAKPPRVRLVKKPSAGRTFFAVLRYDVCACCDGIRERGRERETENIGLATEKERDGETSLKAGGRRT